jgi:predicted membrane chloride channel (bestrophin family)
MQSKRASLKESISNTAIGYALSLILQLIIYPLYGYHIPFAVDLQIIGWFTLLSVARNYCIRRWFNARVVKNC